MLINATQPEELRVALVDGQRLYDLDIEIPGKENRKSNVYKGRITRIEPSLEAAFVDYGADRHGFLPFKEVSRHYYVNEPEPGEWRISIKEALREGQEVVVQVEKDERGNKGAALTTFVSLAGRYLVLMPNNPRASGVSRRIGREDRSELRDVLSALQIPEGMGLIVRTAGEGKSVEELQWDLDYLLNLWNAIQTASEQKTSPFLIYQESNIIIRAIRDYYTKDIGEILVDHSEVFERIKEFVGQVMPENLEKVKSYQDTIPLFSRFQIESQIESAYQHEVRLPSGGAIVIDYTEALVSIDINSGKATRGSDIEETALNTNLEAAEETARQLRLRDIGGLLVIDFIDMTPVRHQRDVENKLRDALKTDRARVQIGRISRFGLLEMSRQRLRASLGESSHSVCPRCGGQGHVRSVSSMALSILRIVEEEALKENTAQLLVQLPVEVSTLILNEKRQNLNQIEQRQGIKVIVLPNANLKTPNFDIRRVRDNESIEELPSYNMPLLDQADENMIVESQAPKPTPDVPAVKSLMPSTAAPEPPKKSFWTRLMASLFGDKTGKPARKKSTTTTQRAAPDRGQQQKRAPQRNRGQSSNRPAQRRPQGSQRRTSGQRPGQRSGQARGGTQQRSNPRTQQRPTQKTAPKGHAKPDNRNAENSDREQATVKPQVNAESNVLSMNTPQEPVEQRSEKQGPNSAAAATQETQKSTTENPSVDKIAGDDGEKRKPGRRMGHRGVRRGGRRYNNRRNRDEQKDKPDENSSSVTGSGDSDNSANVYPHPSVSEKPIPPKESADTSNGKPTDTEKKSDLAQNTKT